MDNPENELSNTLKLAQHFWTEYQYRHDLIWQRIFRLTVAVVFISIIPYAQPITAMLLGNWILLAPILATSLAGFALFFMQHELMLFERIASEYVWQQNKLLATEPKLNIQEPRPFPVFVRRYLLFLIMLSFINGLIPWLVWIPSLAMTTPDLLRSLELSSPDLPNLSG